MNPDVLKKTMHTIVDQKLEALEAHRQELKDEYSKLYLSAKDPTSFFKVSEEMNSIAKTLASHENLAEKIAELFDSYHQSSGSDWEVHENLDMCG